MTASSAFAPADRPALQVSERTRRRDRNERESERVKLLELARELSWLAQEHPRFAPQLNRLMVRVRLQARSGKVKQEIILDALRPSALNAEEICEETLLDRSSIDLELQTLEQQRLVEAVDSQGRSLIQRKQSGISGRWTRYWRVCRPDGAQSTQGITGQSKPTSEERMKLNR